MIIEYLEDYVDRPFEIIDRPLQWQLRGLQQTRSGYGSRLTSSRCVKLDDGRVRRIYVTQWSNAGSAWVILDGRKLWLRS